ncbi:MAG TPA: hypothetical protein VL993_06910 [Stellaceae bacterium]|nr:hypothetical protein [Stellaceae bacterium]
MAPPKPAAKPKPRTIRLTIAQVGTRRFELRDDRGMVLDTVANRLAALDLVNAIKRECDAGWRIEVTWQGCEAP